MKHYFCLSAILMVLCSCFKVEASDDLDMMTGKIIKEWSDEMRKDYDTHFFNKAIGQTLYCLEDVQGALIWPEDVSIPEARRIFVFSAESLLRKFNSHKRIRPYLYNYPFEIKNVCLKIFFRKGARFDASKEGNVSLAYSVGNRIYYFGVRPKSFWLDINTNIFSESYADALKIVREEEAQKPTQGK